MENTRIFVYGSLMVGQAHHGILQGSRSEGRFRTAPKYELVDLGPYPGLVEGGSTSVSGEVYWVDARMLEMLDELEGHPNVYRRVEVSLADGSSAQAYVVPGSAVSGRRRVSSGDWRLFVCEAGIDRCPPGST